jgi:hypothetical protein
MRADATRRSGDATTLPPAIVLLLVLAFPVQERAIRGDKLCAVTRRMEITPMEPIRLGGYAAPASGAIRWGT